MLQIAREVRALDANFDSGQFWKSCSPGWDELELKDRVRRVAQSLGDAWPTPLKKQIGVLKKVAPHHGGLVGFIFPQFVESFALHQPKMGLSALKEFTKSSTGEFAIRPYLRQDLLGTLSVMKQWALDPNEHVRRLSSEGCRPRLPWSFPLKALIADPAPVLPILENLKDDPSLYVRKSVANHLNDISKDHPDLVLRLAKKWIGQSRQTDWILKHALRTLLKKGDQRALKLFGVGQAKNVGIDAFYFVRPTFKIGTRLEFGFQLRNTGKVAQNLRVEYAIYYVKKTKGAAKKVFKLTEKIYAPGLYTLKRGHSLRQMTTRVHLPGVHEIEIVVNGQVLVRKSFNLKR